MKHLISLFILFCLSTSSFAQAELAIGKVPPVVELQGDTGGRLDGKPWSSQEMKGKVHVLFYVDPDEKDLNNDASEAIAKEKFPAEKYGSYGIINMAATWLPNFVISSSLEEKQKKYPSTIYVKDLKKTLVRVWNISDDTSDVLVFDKEGKLIFRKDGKLTAGEIEQLVKVIKDHL